LECSVSLRDVFSCRLVKLNNVLYGQMYFGIDPNGLIELGVVSQCRKYRHKCYHRRIEHTLVSWIMVNRCDALNLWKCLL
jgi:hypothetical protein